MTEKAAVEHNVKINCRITVDMASIAVVERGFVLLLYKTRTAATMMRERDWHLNSVTQ